MSTLRGHEDWSNIDRDSAQRKSAFLVKIKENIKSKKIAPINKVALELLHHRLGHRSTISLMSGDTVNVWQDIELRICIYNKLNILPNIFSISTNK